MPWPEDRDCLVLGEKLWQELTKSIDKTEGTILICTGHFLLVHDEQQKDNPLVPSIAEEIVNADLKKKVLSTFGNFSTFTFEAGAKLLKYALSKGSKAFLTLLVNDWQYVKRDLQRALSEPNRYRRAFFESFKTPPQTYCNILRKYSLPCDRTVWIGHDDDEYFFFRETRLRDQFKRALKNRLN